VVYAAQGLVALPVIPAPSTVAKRSREPVVPELYGVSTWVQPHEKNKLVRPPVALRPMVFSHARLFR
jgi:hypothetical protein